MLDPRIYRAALLPMLVALIVVAFSLANRPEPLRTTFPPDAFDGTRASQLLASLVREFPDRRPGSPEDAALAVRVAQELRAALPAVKVTSSAHSGETIDGERDLVTVAAQQPGNRPRAQLVVVAARDAKGRGAAADLSGTAALIEIARALGDARPGRNVTFASVSGGSGGQAGMRDLVRSLGRPVDAVLELGDLAGRPAGAQVVVDWADGGGAAPVRLQRTVALAVRQETGIAAGAPYARTQLARFAAPVAVSGQGVAGAAGLPAVLLSASGELPADPRAPVSTARLEAMGRSALRALTALDDGPRLAAAPRRDLVISRKVLPFWAVQLLVAALLLPVLLTAIDGVARLRRRGEPLARWIGWVLALAAPVLLAMLFARVLGATGAVPDLHPPAPPGAIPLDASAWVAIAAVVLVLALAMLLVRPVLTRWAGAPGSPDALGAGLAPVVVICALAIAAILVNPYAALLLVLPAHLWLLVGAREVRMRRGVAVALVVLSVAPAALIPLVYAVDLDMSAGGIPWFWLQVFAGGQAGPLALIGWATGIGAALGALLVALRPGQGPEPDRPVTMRGPLTYAGPGSLGGTDSARRR